MDKCQALHAHDRFLQLGAGIAVEGAALLDAQQAHHGLHVVLHPVMQFP